MSKNQEKFNNFENTTKQSTAEFFGENIEIAEKLNKFKKLGVLMSTNEIKELQSACNQVPKEERMGVAKEHMTKFLNSQSERVNKSIERSLKGKQLELDAKTLEGLKDSLEYHIELIDSITDDIRGEVTFKNKNKVVNILDAIEVIGLGEEKANEEINKIVSLYENNILFVLREKIAQLEETAEGQKQEKKEETINKKLVKQSMDLERQRWSELINDFKGTLEVYELDSQLNDLKPENVEEFINQLKDRIDLSKHGDLFDEHELNEVVSNIAKVFGDDKKAKEFENEFREKMLSGLSALLSEAEDLLNNYSALEEDDLNINEDEIDSFIAKKKEAWEEDEFNLWTRLSGARNEAELLRIKEEYLAKKQKLIDSPESSPLGDDRKILINLHKKNNNEAYREFLEEYNEYHLDLYDRILNTIETRLNAPDFTLNEDDYEAMNNAIKPEVASEYERRLNISRDELLLVEGFEDLSEGQQRLLCENASQLLLTRIDEDAEVAYQEDLKGSKLMSRIYKGITKKFQITKHKRDKANESLEGGIAIHREVLQAMTNGMTDKGPKVEYKDGKINILFSEEMEELEFEEGKEAKKAFDKIANEFARISDEHDYGTASRKERKKYAEVAKKFKTARNNLLIEANKEFDSGYVMYAMNNIEAKVKMNQFFNSHPEVENELEKMTEKKNIVKAIASMVTDKGIYFSMGYASRTVASKVFMTATSGALGALSGPALASIFGYFRGMKKGFNDLDDMEKRARQGEENLTTETRDFADSSYYNESIEYLIEESKKETDKDVKLEKMKSLIFCASEALEKLNQGRINFSEDNKLGSKSENIANQYRLIQNIALATNFATILFEDNYVLGENYHEKMKVEYLKDVRAIDEILKNDKWSKSKKELKVVGKEAVKGAGVAFGFSFAGMLIADSMGSDAWSDENKKPGGDLVTNEEAQAQQTRIKEAMAEGESAGRESVEDEISAAMAFASGPVRNMNMRGINIEDIISKEALLEFRDLIAEGSNNDYPVDKASLLASIKNLVENEMADTDGEIVDIKYGPRGWELIFEGDEGATSEAKLEDMFVEQTDSSPAEVEKQPETSPLSNIDTNDVYVNKAEQMGLATIQTKAGSNSIEGVFIKQLRAFPENFGFEGDASDEVAVKRWAGQEAHRIAIDNGYFDPETGQGLRVKGSSAGHNAYVLKIVGDKIGVDEYVDSNIYESHMPAETFEGQNKDEGEYVNYPIRTPSEELESTQRINLEDQKVLISAWEKRGVSQADLEYIGVDISDGLSDSENERLRYIIDRPDDFEARREIARSAFEKNINLEEVIKDSPGQSVDAHTTKVDGAKITEAQKERFINRLETRGVPSEYLDRAGVNLDNGVSNRDQEKVRFLLNHQGNLDKSVEIINISDQVGHDINTVSEYYEQIKMFDGDLTQQSGVLELLSGDDNKEALSKIFKINFNESQISSQDGVYTIKNARPGYDIVLKADGGELKFGVDGPMGWNWGAKGRSFFFNADIDLSRENINKAFAEIARMNTDRKP